MRQVFFLGAGASKPAGFPVMSNLLKELEREVTGPSSKFMNLQIDWEIFQQFRNESQGPLRKVLQSENLELIFTTFDILKESDSTSPKNAIIRILDYYFGLKHCENSRVNHDYLNRNFENLKNGDFIITTNWDALAELTLFKQKKWSPCDGYGFKKNLGVGEIINPEPGESKNLPIPEDMAGPSQIKVLKLHGSIGWYFHPPYNQAYFRGDNFLDYISRDGSNVILRDNDAPGPEKISHDDPAVMIYPTYLKILNNPILNSIWKQAINVLRQAEQVTIVGYSLPNEDIGVRALLLTLVERIKQNEVQVTVINPSESTLERWKEFLGESALVTYNRGEWC